VFNLKSFFPGDEARMTLVDTGGSDTLNASWSAESQKLDLNTDRFSSVGGGLNNLSLSRGTVIENAIGGKGNDFLYGNAGNNVLEGRSGDDILVGGKGADRLIGGAGSDALTGGSGKDTFVFNTAIGASNIDTITDFSVKDDMIELAHTVFKSFHETGSILQAAFNIGNVATSADSLLTYNAANGDLSYDADGTGSIEATVIAHLRTNLVLTYLDFSIA
jgi:serralysin